ncbi:MAG TPA: histidine kinase N-terminal 7TM domain-containing protein, partial [Methanomassiliicoccales archaeon]|nr:histidine kinase N-terminal 7TM domain-containing protein [Methanomassiliicoccales archaeon]
MFEDWLIAVVPNVLVALLSFALGYLALRDHSKPYRRWFAVQSMAIGALALVLAAEKFVTDLDHYLVLVMFEYLFEIVALISLYAFVMIYADRPRYAERKVIYLLAVLGALCLILLGTNEWHNLWYESNEVIQKGDFSIFNNVYGPAYLIWVAFALWILGSCLFVLLASYIHAPKQDRTKYTYVGLAIFWMIAATAIYWVSAKDNPLLDILALGLFGGTFILYYGAFWKSLLDAPPLTILELLENVMDGAVLINEESEVAYWNKAARDALTGPDGKTYPNSLWLKDSPEYDVTLSRGQETITLNFRCRKVPEDTGAEGRVLVLRDVTERRRMENALAEAYQKISVMQSISRHDIKNDLVVLAGHIEL